MKTPLHRRNEIIGLASLLAALGPVGIHAQGLPDLPFTSASTGADGALTFRLPIAYPPCGFGLAYDEARRETILFGGGGPNNQTWSLVGNDWVLKNPSVAPSPRYDPAMTYDAARQQVVLFGGNPVPQSPTALSDTWVWDGTNWMQLNPTTSPPRRTQAEMAFDAVRREVVLFGGYNGNEGTRYTDTWVWNGTNWSARTPATRPPSINAFGMAYDAARERIVVFGGFTPGPGGIGQTWLWDGTNWARGASGPPARSYGPLAYDAVREQVVLFSGVLSGVGSISDTWTWNGTNWASRSRSRAPAGRECHEMVFDRDRERIITVWSEATFILTDLA